MTDQPQATPTIEVHNHSASDAMEWGRIIATLVLCGSIGSVCWGLAQLGWLDLAAGAMTLYLVRFGGVLIAAGVLQSPGGGRAPVVGEKLTPAGLAAMLKTKYTETLASSSILRLAALPIPYVIGYVLAKEAVAWSLQIFTNMWIAGAACGALASVIIAPRLLQGFVTQLRDKSAGPAPAPSAPTAPTQPAVQPTSPAPAPAAPVQPAPIVVRRKASKENHV